MNIRKRAEAVNAYLMRAADGAAGQNPMGRVATCSTPMSNEFAKKINLRLCSSPIS